MSCVEGNFKRFANGSYILLFCTRTTTKTSDLQANN